MGHRLTRIYTRTGDDGTTGLGDGSRAPKNSLRVEVMGEMDELNALIGRLRADNLPAEVQDCLRRIQHELFELGAELCLPGQVRLHEALVARLEAEIDHFNADLEPLREFILPGGNAAAAQAHVIRTVCRRAERHMTSLYSAEGGNPASRHYINRLSDLMFVLARALNRSAGHPDVLWEPAQAPAAPPSAAR